MEEKEIRIWEVVAFYDWHNSDPEIETFCFADSSSATETMNDLAEEFISELLLDYLPEKEIPLSEKFKYTGKRPLLDLMDYNSRKDEDNYCFTADGGYLHINNNNDYLTIEIRQHNVVETTWESIQK